MVETLQFTISFVQLFTRDLALASPIMLLLIAVTMFLGVSIAKIEGWSVIDGAYHAFMNATTVGYGDLHPTRSSTKVLAVLLAFNGLIMTGIVVAIAVQAADTAFDIVDRTV